MITRHFFFICTCFVLFVAQASAATFNGGSRAYVADSTGGLSWNDAAGQKALTVSCWFKISLPDGGVISNPMIIMANSNSSWNGTTLSGNHAYCLFLNPNTGNVDFSAKGTTGTYLHGIVSPYPERWYHVAVVLSNSTVTAY
ncbi:MAG: hypothetical protein JWR15_2865, partial [Prosthecobacter sp.]|nr:hypothetical protein [Prosthecobacter sp.]